MDTYRYEQEQAVITKTGIEFFMQKMPNEAGRVNPHVHSAIEILHIIKGSFHVITDSADVVAGEGSTVLIRSNTVHRIIPLSSGESFYYVLKVKPPVRESGKIEGSAPVTIIGPRGVVTLKEGCIIANRHIHMAPEDGAFYGVKDGDYVTVDAEGTRRTRFYDVQVRVSDAFRLEMHLDTDDANAVGLSNGSKVKIVK